MSESTEMEALDTDGFVDTPAAEPEEPTAAPEPEPEPEPAAPAQEAMDS